jgi:hypothetical protein
MKTSMTAESRDNPLLENGSLKYISATVDKDMITELLEVVISTWLAQKL